MVPRVTLLDAHVLDDHISKIFIGQTLKVLKFLPAWILNSCELELNAILQCLLTYYSVTKTKATFGQHLLGVRFKPDQLTDKKLALFQLFTVGANYIQSKVESPSKNFFNNINDLQSIVIIFKAASFLNFLLFLRQGKYPTLAERFLSLLQESTRQRNIEYTYMTRELLWHGFSELLLFTLPLINYQSIKHKVIRLINSKSHCDKKQWIGKMPLINARTVCTICQEKPILPHHINCSHIFCYYCISSMRMVDEKFECPECYHFENNILSVILD
ncbi:Zinc finger, C3HC4 RING-type,Zinc finger, RING-type,Zinc finger, RING/FYVE/PHD-type,Zinc finger, RING- [Cinara cedri]|uniref:Peroxisome biogenesis factor 2 n=1 Tax=Cinara cedri TaxID=506608 RepID=A0A5E4M6E5_9HEMI|nr:Zinc finger, C3HC4 RING-type,Zinc finger, RING-type,Zinc finger, RING/FYVE/PHD-type,Zinc finger, RING- [Cinara cedri]